MPTLTHLELTVLGNVFKMAPCTAYAIMREFSTSPSGYYRGSAGSIYPLVRRLAERKYITAAEGADGRRAKLTYSLTKKGLTALRRWLSPPLPDDDAAISFDALRTRVYFLSVLSPAERMKFVGDAETRLRQQLSVVEAERERYRRAGDPFSTLAMDGAVRVVRARLAWMRNLRRSLARG